MIAGNAFLALSGPIGWSIASATLLSSIIIFTAKKTKLNKEKNEEILTLKKNIELVKEMDSKIHVILTETIKIREGLNETLIQSLPLYNQDYLSLNNEQKLLLGSLVNTSKALSAMYLRTVGEE